MSATAIASVFAGVLGVPNLGKALFPLLGALMRKGKAERLAAVALIKAQRSFRRAKAAESDIEKLDPAARAVIQVYVREMLMDAEELTIAANEVLKRPVDIQQLLGDGDLSSFVE